MVPDELDDFAEEEEEEEELSSASRDFDALFAFLWKVGVLLKVRIGCDVRRGHCVLLRRSSADRRGLHGVQRGRRLCRQTSLFILCFGEN